MDMCFPFPDLDEDEAVSHRIYDLEVIELSPEISFLILVPPAEGVCSVPGHSDKLDNKPELLSLPVQVFEMSKCLQQGNGGLELFSLTLYNTGK